MSKPAGRKPKKVMKDREPKLEENTKKVLCFQGAKASQLVQTLLEDIAALKKPDSKLMQRKNPIQPFEDHSSIEFFSKQNDCSLFAMGSHSKKRPHNLVLGRTFDYQMLDMVELGVDEASFKSIASFSAGRQCLVSSDFKPMFVFQGEAFESNDDLKVVKNLLLDFFRGQEVNGANLATLNRVFVVSAVPSASASAAEQGAMGYTLAFRHYGIHLKKSSSTASIPQEDGSKVTLPLPRVELEEVGPRVNFSYRRRKQASSALVRESLKRPRAAGSMHNRPEGLAAKQKNIGYDAMGNKTGLVHMERQDYEDLHVQRPRALNPHSKGKAAKQAAKHRQQQQDAQGAGVEGAEGGASRRSKRRKFNPDEFNVDE